MEYITIVAKEQQLHGVIKLLHVLQHYVTVQIRIKMLVMKK